MSDLLECKKIWQGSKNILDERYNGTKTLRLCKDPLFLSLSLTHARTHTLSLYSEKPLPTSQSFECLCLMDKQKIGQLIQPLMLDDYSYVP